METSPCHRRKSGKSDWHGTGRNGSRDATDFRPYSSLTRPRSFLVRDLPAFAFNRRSIAPFDGFVFFRGCGGGAAALAMSFASRSRASVRLRSWVRKRSASMTMTPACRGASSCQRDDAHSNPFWKRWRICGIEAQLNGSGDLVDILSAGPGRADETLLQFISGNGDCIGNNDRLAGHGMVDRRYRAKNKRRCLKAAPVQKTRYIYSAAVRTAGAAFNTEASTRLSNLAKLSMNIPTSFSAWRS